jgi:hypothetical protein
MGHPHLREIRGGLPARGDIPGPAAAADEGPGAPNRVIGHPIVIGWSIEPRQLAALADKCLVAVVRDPATLGELIEKNRIAHMILLR